MRLIDADKFKVYLQEYLHYGHIIPWLDAQPTAFDVDEVVKQLEENKIKRSDDSIYGIGVLNGYAEAIDIVKKRGVT